MPGYSREFSLPRDRDESIKRRRCESVFQMTRRVTEVSRVILSPETESPYRHGFLIRLRIELLTIESVKCTKPANLSERVATLGERQAGAPRVRSREFESEGTAARALTIEAAGEISNSR